MLSDQVIQRDTCIDMNDGNRIPILGMGVYLIPPGIDTFSSVMTALRVGYRHIDTTSIYLNEIDVGLAIKTSKIERGKIFVTTKLWNEDQGYELALKAFDKSLKTLQLDYLDLYLIHWPVYEKRIESWKALHTIRSSGRCRSIGVSNFTVHHLQELIDATGILPAVNQVELSPFLHQSDLAYFCQKHNIVVQSYSPLTAGKRLNDKMLWDIAKKYGKTPAQVLIRWNLQHQWVPLPKSKTPSKILENSLVFDFHLDRDDMERLDAVNENFRTCWDPSGEK
jgi:diketogulonate reductase-like aldo/keto reductase